jgi:hypothetical protein
MENQNNKKEVQSAGPVIRLRMVFKEGKYILKKSVAIEKMTLLNSMKLPKAEKLSGSYAELLDSKMRLRYRAYFEDPDDPYVTLSNEDGSFTHVKSKLKEKHFEVLIPGKEKEGTVIFYTASNKEGISKEVFKLSMNEIIKSINPKNDRR